MTGCGELCETCNTSISSSPFCQCQYPFTNVADLALDSSSDCFIHFELSKGLHAGTATLWCISLVLSLSAFLFTRRSVYHLWVKERYVTAWLVLTCSLCVSWHVLEASAQYPGQYSLGLSLASTILWYLSMFSAFGFLFTLPIIRSGTSVLPFAVQQSPPTLKRLFYPCLLFLFLFSQASFALVFAVYVWPLKATVILKVLFVGFPHVLPMTARTNI